MPPFIVAQIDTTVKVIDNVSTKDFQWWFAALLVIGILVIGLVSKYFTALFKTVLDRQNKIEDERVTFLQTQNAQLHAIITQNAAAMNNNADAFREFSEMINSVKHLVSPFK